MFTVCKNEIPRAQSCIMLVRNVHGINVLRPLCLFFSYRAEARQPLDTQTTNIRWTQLACEYDSYALPPTFGDYYISAGRCGHATPAKTSRVVGELCEVALESVRTLRSSAAGCLSCRACFRDPYEARLRSCVGSRFVVDIQSIGVVPRRRCGQRPPERHPLSL